jgi:hypothetical protein
MGLDRMGLDLDRIRSSYSVDSQDGVSESLES